MGIGCDGCDRRPIYGRRYRCLTCDNFDICGDCNDNAIHGKHRKEQILSMTGTKMNTSEDNTLILC